MNWIEGRGLSEQEDYSISYSKHLRKHSTLHIVHQEQELQATEDIGSL